MKTRRLSEIDLARFASLPRGPVLDQALRNYNSGGGAWSYDPVRHSTADIVAAKTPLHGEIGEVPWEKIRSQIVAACKKGEAQIKSNCEVGKVLFDAARKDHWSAAKYHMGRMPIGIGETVRYWNDVLLADDDGTFIPFFDHRREHGVANKEIRRIIYSFQHLWIRDRNPDLANARLAILRFPMSGEHRGIKVQFAIEEELFSVDELDQRVRTVYEAWVRVSEARVHDSRRTGTGGSNPFGF